MENPVQVKICGIRSSADLEAALLAEPDAVGFICGTTHYSEDELAPQEAKRLSALAAIPTDRSLPKRVLVTHLDDADKILALAEFVDVEAIQVHGLVSRDELQKVYERRGKWEIVRAVHVTDESVFETVEDVADLCDMILLDSRTETRLGGTGQTHDWNISRKIAEALTARGKRVALAGGLTPDNVEQAITIVQPWAVDVNSGVDDEDDNKSEQACAEFVSAARPGDDQNR